MKIKKNKKNQYVLNKDRLWIRDFTRPYKADEINQLVSPEEYSFLCENEIKNKKFNIALVEKEVIKAEKVVIMSNGFDFNNNLENIAKLGKSTLVIAVNGVLKNWKNFKIDYYLINNPYVPKIVGMEKLQVFPKIITSKRTSPALIESLKKKKALMYQYSPNSNFGSNDDHFLQVDDYRNPICAAFHLSYLFGAKKIGLLFCDDSFKDQKPSSIKLDNGLYCYEQQLKYENIIDCMGYWLHGKEEPYELYNCSLGNKLDHFKNVGIDEFVELF